ncbi:MAG: CotH kinase family protein [Oscillospiraceae bacterium]|jgi:hypothetical protein|nr:CotH kinase family protein [Oscillospiraceae bacterium]
MKTTKKLLSLLLAIMVVATSFAGLTSAFAAEQTKQYVYGDADMDGSVTIADVTAIQKHLAVIDELGEDAAVLADVDDTVGVSVADATTIQKHLAQMNLNSRIGEPYESQDTILTEDVLTPAIPFATTTALYAHGVAYNGDATHEAWAKWEEFEDAFYLFLPTSANKNFVEIYNGFNNDVTIDGKTIPPQKSRYIAYETNAAMSVSGAVNATLKIMTSNTEGALYFNTLNSSSQYDANEFKLVNESEEKTYSTSGTFVLADKTGFLQSGDVKKFKGRGNSTWGKNKKPYNINFNDTIDLNGLAGKKFSMLANYQDSSFVRNRVLYDMADEIGLPYSPDSRFIDFYVNGNYEGTYQLSDKVEMGKKHLVALEDNASDAVTENFNFLIELGNYADDEICVKTDRGSFGQLKNPESDSSTSAGRAQLRFISAKFQELEDALFSKDLTKLAQIADVDSFAKMYLINEFSKNVDGGNYSTFFTYNAEEDIFIATPVWDFDCAIGNLYDKAARQKIEKPTNFYTKHLASSGGNINWLAKFLQAPGAEARVAAIYKETFPNVMKVLTGDIESTNGRLKSMAEYEAMLTDTLAMNYKMWQFPVKGSPKSGPVGEEVEDKEHFEWIPDQSKLEFINSDLSTANRTYSKNFAGSFDFVNDWMISRYNWLADYYADFL